MSLITIVNLVGLILEHMTSLERASGPDILFWSPLRSLTIIANLTTVIRYKEHSMSACIK